jgi:hypothetical protein
MTLRSLHARVNSKRTALIDQAEGNIHGYTKGRRQAL